MLRHSDRQKLIQLLEESYFGYANFEVKFGQATPDIFLVIFIPNPSYLFEVAFDSNSFETHEVPGEELMHPTVAQCRNIADVFNRMDGWVQRVREDTLVQNPFAKEIQLLREEVAKRLASTEKDLDEFFTVEEAGELESKLNALYERVNGLAKDNEDLRGTVSKLAATIEQLKSAAGEVNRGTWYRMASGRLLSGLKSFARAKEVREFALQAAKKLLLD